MVQLLRPSVLGAVILVSQILGSENLEVSKVAFHSLSSKRHIFWPWDGKNWSTSHQLYWFWCISIVNENTWTTPWQINCWNPKSWRFSSDDFPFQLFVGAYYSLRLLYPLNALNFLRVKSPRKVLIFNETSVPLALRFDASQPLHFGWKGWTFQRWMFFFRNDYSIIGLVKGYWLTIFPLMRPFLWGLIFCFLEEMLHVGGEHP